MSMSVLQHFLVRYRVRLSFVVFFVLVFDWMRHVEPYDLLSFYDADRSIGGLLVITGAAIRSWAAGIIEKKAVLATEGPYAVSRHPLYLGSFVIMFGFAAMLEDELTYTAVAALAAMVYVPTIRTEEKLLAAKFGPTWERYAAHTGMFWPKRLPLALGGTWRLNQWIKNREYRALFSVIVVVFGWEIWSRWIVD